MKTMKLLLVALIFTLLSCTPAQTGEISPLPTASPPVPATRPAPSSTSETQSVPSITAVTWDSDNHAIHIQVDPWPKSFEPWTAYIDGVEIPARDENGAVVIRPNAPLSQPPDGLIVGTLPWVTGLDSVDFPCCGSLQFSVPGMGRTNTFDYNLVDAGCATASARACTSEWTVHEGDWIIAEGGTETIENAKLRQKGNIYIRNSAELVLRNSELMLERGSTPTVHLYIFVDPGGSLLIENSRIYPEPESGNLACVMNRGRTSILDSPTSIHYFDMSEGAQLTMQNSSMIFEIGGLLQVTGGSTSVKDSTLGALALEVPAGAHLDASGLKSGAYFESWKVQDMIPDADYELTLDKVTVLKDDFTGEYEHGPYERGWIFFLDGNAHVRLSDSELRKVFIDVRDDTAEFRDLKIGEPSSLTYRDIVLQDIVLMGQWPFTITNSNVTITDSNYLFLQPSGSSTIRLVNSHIVEFIPRGFFGTMSFENGSWTTAGEILGGVDYHSGSNNFKITGSLKIGPEVRQNLRWKDATVTREFDVVLTGAQGNPLDGAEIRVAGQSVMTDATGRAKFSIVFTQENYNRLVTVEAWAAGTLIDQQRIDFFTETPIRLSQ